MVVMIILTSVIGAGLTIVLRLAVPSDQLNTILYWGVPIIVSLVVSAVTIRRKLVPVAWQGILAGALAAGIAALIIGIFDTIYLADLSTQEDYPQYLLLAALQRIVSALLVGGVVSLLAALLFSDRSRSTGESASNPTSGSG